MIIDKGKFLKTVGWVTVGIGFYIIAIGSGYDVESFFDERIQPDDDVIDAEFKVVE